MKTKIFIMLLSLMTLACVAHKPESFNPQAGLSQYLTSYVSYFYNPQLQLPAASATGIDTIIFDIDGVLTKTDYLVALPFIGNSVLWYMWENNVIKPCTKDVFKPLYSCPAISTDEAYREDERLPQIMVDYKTGKISYEQAYNIMINHINNSNYSPGAKAFFAKTVKLMTDPKTLQATKKVLPGAEQLLHALKKDGYKLYILSNGEHSSFELLQQKFPELFMYEAQPMFDGIMLANDEGIVKPNPQMYKNCLHKFNIDPKRAIFIDDTQKNIEGAQQVGITGIKCSNMRKVQNQLQKILSSKI